MLKLLEGNSETLFTWFICIAAFWCMHSSIPVVTLVPDTVARPGDLQKNELRLGHKYCRRVHFMNREFQIINGRTLLGCKSPERLY